jgi:hypothetical protein
MANVTGTTAGVFIPELWAEAIKDYAERSLILKNLVTDMSDLASVGGSKINIPRVDEETVGSAKAEDGAVTYEATTSNETELSLNQHFYEAKRIEDVATVQSSYDLFSMYTEAMGYSLAKKVENYIAGLIQSATANDVTLTADNMWGSGTAGAGSEHLREGMANLWARGIDTASGQTYLYCSPESYKNLLALDEFASAMKRGDNQNPYVSGALGMVYGMPVFVSSDWDGDGDVGDETASIFTKNAVAVAIQHLRVQSQYDIDYLATSVVVDCLFGGVLLHNNFVSNFNNIA